MATASTLVSLARKLSENEIELLLSTADALSVLNEVYADVLAAYSWPFMQSSTDVTFTSGTKNIGVTRGVVWIEDSEGNRLLQRGPYPQDWRTDRTGAPREFFIEWTMPVTGEPETTVHVYPTPVASEVLTVRKVNAPTALAGTDTPRIPTEYHNMLAYEAAARFLEREADDSGRVEALRTQFQVMLEAMRMAVFGTHTSFSMGIRGRYQRRRAR